MIKHSDAYAAAKLLLAWVDQECALYRLSSMQAIRDDLTAKLTWIKCVARVREKITEWTETHE